MSARPTQSSRRTEAQDAQDAQLVRERRQAELNLQQAVLANIEFLSFEDTAKVLVEQPSGVIVLIDARSAIVKIPAFQFLRGDDGFKRNQIAGTPILNPDVQAVFRQQNASAANRIILGSEAWFMLNWWLTEMRLDVSDPESRPFRPIDAVGNSQTLAKLVDWFKDWADESYG